MALKHADLFRLDVGLVGAACVSSLQQAVGIVVLEEYLVRGPGQAGAEPRAKRSRLAEEGQSLIWIELAKLYRCLSDYDSIKGRWFFCLGMKGERKSLDA